MAQADGSGVRTLTDEDVIGARFISGHDPGTELVEYERVAEIESLQRGYEFRPDGRLIVHTSTTCLAGSPVPLNHLGTWSLVDGCVLDLKYKSRTGEVRVQQEVRAFFGDVMDCKQTVIE